MTRASPSMPIRIRHHKRIRPDQRAAWNHQARLEDRIAYLEDQLAAARDWIKHLIKQQEAARAPVFAVSRETRP